MPAEHTYRHATYRMRRGGVTRYASKVTRDDGAVVRLCDLLCAEEAIERARKMFDGHRSYNGTRPADLAERIEKAESAGQVRRAVLDLLDELAREMPADWEYAPAIQAAVRRRTALRMG